MIDEGMKNSHTGTKLKDILHFSFFILHLL